MQVSAPVQAAESNPDRIAKPHIAQHDNDSTYTLLDRGDRFRNYTVVRLLNKDVEGIKYVVKKDNDERLFLLKVFHNFFFDRAEKVFSLQMRLNKLNTLRGQLIPHIEEINQMHVPRFLVADFVEGLSLSDIKQKYPQRLSEAFVRKVGAQLIEVALLIHNHGLSINTINLLGVMVNDHDEITILLSGISFEENIDEREDIFTIGVILAQLLSKSGLYQTIYSMTRLRQHKFTYINGTSVSLNKFLAECLHRNILQRFKSMESMQKNFGLLLPLEGDNIHTDRDIPTLIPDEINNEPAEKPKRVDVFFWALSGFILVLVILLLTTNIYSFIFGAEDVKFEISFSLAPDSVRTEESTPIPERSRNIPVTETGYGSFRDANEQDPEAVREDPRKRIQVQAATKPASNGSARHRAIPADFVLIESNTFGFGRLKENLHHNVSISGFYISKYEVTQGEWNRFMKPANVSQRGDNLPVDNISWFDAVLYANGLSQSEGLTPCYKIRGLGSSRVVTCDFRANGYRLPTETEWEMAAKGAKLFNYSGSEDLDEVAWYRDNSASKVRAGGLKNPNDFGIYDMSGNVSEWCWDWYDVNYPRTLTTFVNPTGPETGTHKSIRGGNILSSEGRNLNILFRDKGEPSRGYPYIGFRLVRA